MLESGGSTVSLAVGRRSRIELGGMGWLRLLLDDRRVTVASLPND